MATEQQPPPRPAQPVAAPAAVPVVERAHPVHRFLGRLHEVLDTVDTETAWSMSTTELGESLREAYAGIARLSALALTVLAQADRSELAAESASPNLTAWLREQVRLAPAEARRQIALAKALDVHPLTAQALASGAFPPASAAVIVAAVDRLPDEVGEAVKVRAEEYLAGEAHAHDTTTLRRLAVHLDEVVDPEGAEQRLGEALARADAKAARETYLSMHHDEVNQVTTGTFRTPLTHGLKLQRMIESLTNPGRPDPIGFEDPVTGTVFTAEHRRGQALCELLDRFPATRLPRYGGSAPTVVVTMTLATLLGGLQAARVDTGQIISAGMARRLAAQHGVVPAVLGSDSEMLDLGRRCRFLTKPQRLAKVVEQDGTCAVVDCTRSAVGADGAHLIGWAEGGPTDLAQLALLCRRHHVYADHPGYTFTRVRPGRIRIHRRC